MLVVADEIHGDLSLPPNRYTPFGSLGPEHAANAVCCQSPAKTFNIPALSSAFTIVPDEQRRMAMDRENRRFTVNKNNAFANVAMVAAYRGADQWLDALLDYLGGNIKLVRERLEDWPNVELIEPDGTFLLWMDFRKLGYSPADLGAFLRDRAGWAVTRGEAFGEQGRGFVRVNIGCTRARLGIALDRLGKALEYR